MKSKTWALIIGVIALLCGVLSIPLLLPGAAAGQAQITSGGIVIATVSLDQDQEFTVPAPKGGSNTVTVKDGRIAVTAASCPDHYCMKRGFGDSGAQIVCLPNGLVISFLGESEIDGAVG